MGVIMKKSHLLSSRYASPGRLNQGHQGAGETVAEKRAALESELSLLKMQLDRTAYRIDVVIRSMNCLREARMSQRRKPQPQQLSSPAANHTTKECRRKITDRRLANIQVEGMNG